MYSFISKYFEQILVRVRGRMKQIWTEYITLNNTLYTKPHIQHRDGARQGAKQGNNCI